jgi:transposase
LAAVAQGLSHRQAGERFGVSGASVSRWRALERQRGEARARSQGRDRRSGQVEAHKDTILALIEATPDVAIEELRQALADKGVSFGYGAIRRLFVRHAITRKKRRRSRPSRTVPDILKRRKAWFEGQLDLDPERLVFIDETWAWTKMAPTHGRCRPGERLRVGVPHGHWKTTNFVAALTKSDMVAPFVLDGPINRNAFETYVERVLSPELRKGDIVVMDNLSSHKGMTTHQRIEAAGATLLYLPPYSPDFSPIENAFAKLKALLRKAAKRTIDGLWTAIGRFLDLFSPAERRNYFAAAGYDRT